MPHGIKGVVVKPGQPVFGLPVMRIVIEQDAQGNVRTSFNRPLTGPQAVKLFGMAIVGQADWMLQQGSLLINPNRNTETEPDPEPEEPEQNGNETKA